MQFTRNTSSSKRVTGLIIKLAIVGILFTGLVFILSKIDFQHLKRNRKIIPNENFRIVK